MFFYWKLGGVSLVTKFSDLRIFSTRERLVIFLFILLTFPVYFIPSLLR